MALVVSLFFGFPDGQRFVAPGSVVIEVTDPHEYTVWLESGSEFEGEWYTNPDRPKEFRVRVFEETTGREVAASPYFSTTETMGTRRRSSMASFEVAEPGRYRVEVEGDFKNRLLFVRRSMLGRMFLTIFGSLALVGGGTLIGIVLFVSVFLKRRGALRST